MNLKRLFLLTAVIWGGAFSSLPTWAGNYAYEGKVDGMVCAFCAYNVSKQISSLPGVDSQTVDVDLKAGKVMLRSSAKIEHDAIAKVFAGSGFSLTAFQEVAAGGMSKTDSAAEPLMTISFDGRNAENLESIFDAVGELAVARTGRLRLSAPAASEIEILKPILGGRQNVIKVQFVPVENQPAKLSIFAPGDS